MIFCFSGTGNSLHVANRIAEDTNDKVIFITENERKLKKKYVLKDNEKLGFVFPIYWWGMPMEVEKFIDSLDISNYKNQHTYAVVTYGLLGNNGALDLRKKLNSKDIELTANYEVKMVDNYIVGYELAKVDKQKDILTKAEKDIDKIVLSILNRDSIKITDILSSTIKPIVHSFYKRVDHKKKFYVMDTCVGCGICERECPCNAIKIEESKVTWIKNCSFCQKCIHNCPKEAIQYGKTEGRKRYNFRKEILK